MRVPSHPYLAIILSAPVAAALMASLACQSAQKPVAVAPPAQAQAPTLVASGKPSNPPQPKSTAKPTAKPAPRAGGTKPAAAVPPAAEPQSKRPTPRQLAVDPAADLIAAV